MTPTAFSNAMVATVGAYAEIVAEQKATIDQLTAALQQKAAAKKPLSTVSFQCQVDGVIAAARKAVANTGEDEIRLLRDALVDYDNQREF